ncbi:protein translocase subunit SecD [Thiobacillus sp.]|uniref:protein translocase subunit SecD n=1 Tax=Thiobacillus sp. TaxID=924 RepID=UPI0018395393|nr:protein translocase subunit SecD [Thiobacillus sp.]MBC2730711.1 protein translocase subunit SecD [Thiobacillus sp.]MBC2739448.1 protein translocase subunit SecD [Thiobacillus sp.]MBC2760271.1 protein translocase subunit SecD [Thiobacillus sp.]MBD3811102.1 protein translocase subunit SecD [Betaproteobacteria bacterium]
MNRFPLWKYVLIGITLVIAFLYTLPNFFGEVPAVQISPIRTTEKVDTALLGQVESSLKAANLGYQGMELAGNSIKVRLASTDQQIKAKDVLQNSLGERYTVALNLVSASPAWLSSIHALPMYLGLDLRGGVHFLLEVDMKAALEKAAIRYQNDFRTELRGDKIRYGRISREGNAVTVHFATRDQRDAALNKLGTTFTDLAFTTDDQAEGFTLTARLKPQAETQVQEFALQQNITTLRNRVNELGVAEPVIQQQGASRVVVQLPGVQDTAKAKDILGRTATLEIRMVDEQADPTAIQQGQAPFGDDIVSSRDGGKIAVKKDVVLTGDSITDASPGFESTSGQAAVHINLDGKGARIFKDVTRENVGKRMAILLIEKGVAEAITSPVIREEIGGGRVQITGMESAQEASDVALLLRAGALAAPMQIVEERTVGPSMGAENISKGFHSNLWGFLAVTVFMVLYYRIFGLFSSIALAVNGFFLVALLSMLQATLTLPGLAGIALTLGMAIDANVLINERIREELRNGATPQAAIHAGYDRAWGTILDSNLTTLIAGVALFWLGSGPVRGFAVVLCLGILTSMFSAVTVSRAMVNLTYGRQARLAKVSI